MTRGYYVLETGNKILEAAYLSGDAYLCEGYGEKIIRAFSENKETEYLHQLIAEMTDYDQENVTDLVPECYRITKKSEDRPFVNYSYVLCLLLWKVNVCYKKRNSRQMAGCGKA